MLYYHPSIILQKKMIDLFYYHYTIIIPNDYYTGGYNNMIMELKIIGETIPPKPPSGPFNPWHGNSKILKWRYSTMFGHIFWGDSLNHRSYVSLIYGGYLQASSLPFSHGQWSIPWNHHEKPPFNHHFLGLPTIFPW